MESATKKCFNIYEDAVNALNELQSPVNKIKRIDKIQLMNTCFQRSGMSFESLDQLRVIHVTGTKGKGSTCAYVESILRHHGHKTGFFSSPHLVNVTERIKVNGLSIDRNTFTNTFWEIHDKLEETDAMATYFQMLLLIALNVFIKQRVDVAIIEVGIGGEYDSTNFLRIVQVAAITSLGIDHTPALGNTIESIAWHKSGIMKKGCRVFTSPQCNEAMRILKERSVEKECTLEIVELSKDSDVFNCIRPPFNVNGLNASLAVITAHSWLKINAKPINWESTYEGLKKCYWPGRFEKLCTDRIDFYLDGAHTYESIQHCSDWFGAATKNSPNKKALMFNMTGSRNTEKMLNILKQWDFDLVCFVPNIATEEKSPDNASLQHTNDELLEKCEYNKTKWLELIEHDPNGNQEVIVRSTISSALKSFPDNVKYNLLITGSLHLIGEMRSLIAPN